MKRPSLPLFIFLLVISMTAVAQPSKELSLEDAILKQRTTFAPENLSQVHWIPETEDFLYLKEIDEEYNLLSGNAEKVSRRVLATLGELNAALSDVGGPELTRFPFIKVISKSEFRFVNKNKIFIFDWAEKKVKEVNEWSEEAANPDINEQHAVAYTKDNNLWISLPGKKDVAVTEESNKDIRNGEASHRFEFGISKGTFWSPKGDKLAFYRTDETMVTDYPVIDWSKRPASHTRVKYPFAGDKSHQTTLGVYDVETKKTIFLKTGGDPEHYLTNIAWSPDGKFIYMAELERDQNILKLNIYDAATGELVRTVFQDGHMKWMEPTHAPVFLPGNDTEFLWMSDRDGFDHLYQYGEGDAKARQVTRGDWNVFSIERFDEKGKFMFITTTEQSGTDRHVYMVNMKSAVRTLMTPGAGTHTVKVHPSGKYIIDSWNSIEVPRKIRIIETKKGTVVQELLEAKDPLADYKISKPEFFKIKAGDGKTDLHCRMFKPTTFDSAKKYPVLVYVYNGPSVQLVRNTWMGAAPLWMPYAAEKGYIVFTVDGRGSANRGRDFEHAIYRHLGDKEILDQLEGVKWLKSQPWVDAGRMVVHGWSYGGFMTCNLMLRAPGTFNAGVAGGPVIDWKMYEIMYTERYMDTPKTNAEGYKNANVLNYVKDLKGKLLLIHGTSDDVVVWQHSIEFLEKAVTEGVQVDYFVYPNHHHNVRGKDRVHLLTKVLDYLMENNK